MPTPHIDAIGLVASDLDRTVAFYRALGCELPDPPWEDGTSKLSSATSG
jgi:catechol 2,3-dioxygenase-like lactoylglutathione lyase family enzyme